MLGFRYYIGWYTTHCWHRLKLLDSNPTIDPHQQRTMTTFFSPIAPTHATSQSRTTQVGSRSRRCKRVTIDLAMTNFVPVGPSLVDHNLAAPYHPQIKCHYLLWPLQMRPSLWIYFHFELIYAWNLPKTEITICLTWEPCMYKQWGCLVILFLSIYIYFGLFSKTR